MISCKLCMVMLLLRFIISVSVTLVEFQGHRRSRNMNIIGNYVFFTLLSSRVRDLCVCYMYGHNAVSDLSICSEENIDVFPDHKKSSIQIFLRRFQVRSLKFDLLHDISSTQV